MVAIGIDLGTTYSCVGWWKDNRCDIIANDQGNRTTPSYVAFTDTERIIGDGAKNQSSMNPENTIFDAKRLIGRDFNDKTLQSDLKQFPFKVKDDKNKPVIEVQYKNETIIGVVYNPAYDQCFHAVKNQGAFLNNKSIKPSSC